MNKNDEKVVVVEDDGRSGYFPCEPLICFNQLGGKVMLRSRDKMGRSNQPDVFV